MKRDLDLARQILLAVEARPAGARPVPVTIDGHSDLEVADHVRLLVEAGLLDALDASSFSGPAWLVRRLTWEGHDFIETARVESIWLKAKTIVLRKGGALSFEVLKQVLATVAREVVSG